MAASSSPSPSPSTPLSLEGNATKTHAPLTATSGGGGKQPIRVVVVHGDPSLPNRILPGGKWDEDDFDTIDRLKSALSSLESGGTYSFTYLCQHSTLYADLHKMRAQGLVDIVLQFCDEGFMNDPRQELHMCAMLEILRIPYTGTGAHSLALSYDKDIVLRIAESIGVPVPRSQYLSEGHELEHTLEYPVLVKPNHTDGSYGITAKSICHDEQQLVTAVKMIRDTFKVRGAVLVQEYLPGADLNFALLGNPTVNAQSALLLPITEEDYSAVPAEYPRILGFESKWLPDSPYWHIQTVPTHSVTADTQARMKEHSLRLFARLGYRDYARFDWRLDARGNPRLLEVNPNCGWCWDGHLAKTAASAGLTYAGMLDKILSVALERYSYESRAAQLNQPANIDLLVKQVAIDSSVTTATTTPTTASSSTATTTTATSTTGANLTHNLTHNIASATVQSSSSFPASASSTPPLPTSIPTAISIRPIPSTASLSSLSSFSSLSSSPSTSSVTSSSSILSIPLSSPTTTSTTTTTSDGCSSSSRSSSSSSSSSGSSADDIGNDLIINKANSSGISRVTGVVPVLLPSSSSSTPQFSSSPTPPSTVALLHKDALRTNLGHPHLLATLSSSAVDGHEHGHSPPTSAHGSDSDSDPSSSSSSSSTSLTSSSAITIMPQPIVTSNKTNPQHLFTTTHDTASPNHS